MDGQITKYRELDLKNQIFLRRQEPYVSLKDAENEAKESNDDKEAQDEPLGGANIIIGFSLFLTFFFVKYSFK